MRARAAVLSLVSALALGGLVAVPSCGSGAGSSSADAGNDASTNDATADQAAPPACPGGKVLCSGVCVDSQTEPANCGACGQVCAAPGKCCAGVCLLDTATCSFTITSVFPKQGTVNGGDYLTLRGTGFVPGMRVQIGDALAPVRAIDATTAIVQASPGAVGSSDITVIAGPNFSTLPDAYLYVTAGIQLPWLAKPMSVVRGEAPALAVMKDGRVLIAGGTQKPGDATQALRSAEIYAPSTGVVTDAKNTMSITRWHSSAVAMLTGKVLVVGGAAPALEADVFDPATDTFAPTANKLKTARGDTRAVLMIDGRLMISSSGEQTAEIYDPDKDTFTQIPTNAVHTLGFIVRLRDGRVLLGGGDAGQTAVEIFDPAQSKFVLKAPLNQGRSMLTAHTLPDGRVLAIGGASLSAAGVHVPLDSVEVYDPQLDAWTVAPYKLNAAAAPNTGRTGHASALLRDGTVLVMGGYNVDTKCDAIDSVDQIDPVKNTVAPLGKLVHPNTAWTAVTLLDGSVLGVGGGACGAQTALPSLDFLLGTH